MNTYFEGAKISMNTCIFFINQELVNDQSLLQNRFKTDYDNLANYAY